MFGIILDLANLFSCFLYVVLGSMHWPLSSVQINGSMRADGQSYAKPTKISDGTLIGGLGGGSGGTILLFLQELVLLENSSLSVNGGHGGPLGGGGGGGGRVHFHWSKIYTGDEYVPLATVRGIVNSRYAYYSFYSANFMKTSRLICAKLPVNCYNSLCVVIAL